MTVNEMKARKMGYWPHMCVGAAHLIVPSYMNIPNARVVFC